VVANWAGDAKADRLSTVGDGRVDQELLHESRQLANDHSLTFAAP
jgi:hypothetical protein